MGRLRLEMLHWSVMSCCYAVLPDFGVLLSETAPASQQSEGSPDKPDQSAAANTHPHDTKESSAVHDAAIGKEHGGKSLIHLTLKPHAI